MLYGTKRGDSATYTCFAGFSLSGDDIRYCQDDGQWGGVAPRCNCKFAYAHIVTNATKLDLYELCFVL